MALMTLCLPKAGTIGASLRVKIISSPLRRGSFLLAFASNERIF